MQNNRKSCSLLWGWVIALLLCTMFALGLVYSCRHSESCCRELVPSAFEGQMEAIEQAVYEWDSDMNAWGAAVDSMVDQHIDSIIPTGMFEAVED